MTRYLLIFVSLVISIMTLTHATPVLRRAPTEAPFIEGVNSKSQILGTHDASLPSFRPFE